MIKPLLPLVSIKKEPGKARPSHPCLPRGAGSATPVRAAQEGSAPVGIRKFPEMSVGQLLSTTHGLLHRLRRVFGEASAARVSCSAIHFLGDQSSTPVRRRHCTSEVTIVKLRVEMCSVWLAWHQQTVSTRAGKARRRDWLTLPCALHLVLLEGLKKLVCNLVRRHLMCPCWRHDQGSLQQCVLDR